jgi:predicted dienelactone hydrolase
MSRKSAWTGIIALGILGSLGVHSAARAAGPVTTDSLAGPGRFAVGITTVTVVDPKRSTPASGAFPGSSVRTLVTDVYYPAASGTPGDVVRDAPLDARDGRFPLIVFAHGSGANRTVYPTTLAHLAGHGYVLAAPDFPLTSSPIFFTSGDIADLVNQPGDLSFEIDTLTGLGDSAGGAFAPVVDPAAVGVLGHSFGGATALLAAFGGPLADPRFKAAAALAPLTCFFGRQMFAGTSLPVLVLHGTDDEFVDPAWSRDTFAFIQPSKFLGEIVHGDHLGFTFQGFRDNDVIGPVGSFLNNLFTAQYAPFSAALTAAVPGADPTRCFNRSFLLPNPDGTPDTPIPLDEQQRITNVALTAFFDAFLRHDISARRYFLRLSRRDAFGRELRFCKSTRRARPCHLPPLPSSPSGAFVG